MTLVLYICIVIIVGELPKEVRRNLPRSPEHTAMTRSVAMPSNLGMLSSGKSSFIMDHCFLL